MLLDIESFSEEDLKASGAYRYAEHPSTELLCAAYELNGTMSLWVPCESLPEALLRDLDERLKGKNVVRHFSKTVPADFLAYITSGGKIRAHNASFERVVLAGTAGRKLGLPVIPIESFVCTSAKMAANGLPRALGDAAAALGAPPKSGEGRLAMLAVSKPRKPTKALADTRWTPENAPDKFATLYSYNVQDVEAERGIDELVPDLTASEQKIWELDQKINDRGILVDIESVNNILFVIEEYKTQLAAECEELTRGTDWLGEVTKGFRPTQRDKIADWIRVNGYSDLEDMQADTVKWILKQKDVPENVKRVLLIYSTYNAKAITKFQPMLDAVCADGRLRGMFLYHAAHTGRWASMIVQLHNLFRPVIDDPETAIEAFRLRSLDWIRTLYHGIDPIKVAASCVRSVLIAAPGKVLTFPDFAGIESRINAWLFEEEWKLQVFRDYDTILGTDEKGEPIRKGPDVYRSNVSRMLSRPVETVTKKERQELGKPTELSFNYEGGVGAIVKMATQAGFDLEVLAQAVLPILPVEAKESAEWMYNKYGKSYEDLSRDAYIACDGLKYLWRQAHPNIKQGWKDLKTAAEQAVQYPGQIFAIPTKKAMFKVTEYKGNQWLCMRLPSGRQLKYFKPRWIPEESRIVKDRYGNDQVKVTPGELRYWGVDTDTRQWQETSSYGGHWDNNLDQGYGRDLLVGAIQRLEDAGYPVVLHVHDEPCSETGENFGSLEEAKLLMCQVEKHADGLPIAVDGHRQMRYRK